MGQEHGAPFYGLYLGAPLACPPPTVSVWCGWPAAGRRTCVLRPESARMRAHSRRNHRHLVLPWQPWQHPSSRAGVHACQLRTRHACEAAGSHFPRCRCQGFPPQRQQEKTCLKPCTSPVPSRGVCFCCHQSTGSSRIPCTPGWNRGGARLQTLDIMTSPCCDVMLLCAVGAVSPRYMPGPHKKSSVPPPGSKSALLLSVPKLDHLPLGARFAFSFLRIQSPHLALRYNI